MREVYKLDGLGVVGRVIAGEVSCIDGEAGPVRIPLLESPDGLVVGALERRRGEYGSCEAILIQGDHSEKLWRGWDLPEISYESLGLVYFEERDGFARVLKDTVPPGVWVRVSDMPGGRLRPWPELLVESPRRYLGYDGYALRFEPSEFSGVIVELRDSRAHETQVHQLIPTGEVVGDWAEFEVVEYDGEFYALAQTREAYPTGSRWKGWLRIVDGDGLPRLWFATRD